MSLTTLTLSQPGSYGPAEHTARLGQSQTLASEPSDSGSSRQMQFAVKFEF